MLIYKTTNLINNKIYIGQKQIMKTEKELLNSNYYGSNKKLKEDIKSIGKENFKREIIDYSDDFDELNKKEEYWIEKYDATNPEIGYNVSKKTGKNFWLGCHHTDESKAKTSKIVYQYDLDCNFIKEYPSIKETQRKTNIDVIRISNNYIKIIDNYIWMDHKLSDDEIFNIKKIINGRKTIKKMIYQYDLNGTFIRKYKSITDASKYNNINSNLLFISCNNVLKTAKNFFWSYTELNKDEINYRLYLYSVNKKMIYQYDLNGNLIKEYKSITEASNITNVNISNICSCCSNKNKTAGGFFWSFKKIDKNEIKEKISNKYYKHYSRNVYQYDLDCNFIKEYKSIKNAMKETNIHSGNISKCCSGKTKTAGGFKWFYNRLEDVKCQ